MTLQEYQAHLARRYVDPTYTAEIEGLPKSAVDRYARSLWSKRYGEAIGTLPLTARLLGKAAHRLFDRHCAAYRPRGPRRPMDDAMAFLEFLLAQSLDEAVHQAARSELKLLALRWVRDDHGIRSRPSPKLEWTESGLLLWWPGQAKVVRLWSRP